MSADAQRRLGDLVGDDLDLGPLVAVLGLPAALRQRAGDDGAGALGDGLCDVLRQERKHVTSKKLTSSSPSCLRLFQASPKLATAMPPCVNRSSGCESRCP